MKIQSGHHEPSLSTICGDSDLAEQDAIWQLLMSYLSEDFSRDELETYKVGIIRHIWVLLERGELREVPPYSSIVTEQSGDSACISQAFDIFGTQPTAIIPYGEARPYYSSVESDKKGPLSGLSEGERYGEFGSPLAKYLQTDEITNRTGPGIEGPQDPFAGESTAIRRRL